MNSRTRSRKPASIGSNQSSRRCTAVAACDCKAGAFVLLLIMAWSPPAHQRRHCLGFNHPETTPPSIPTTLRTAPAFTPDPNPEVLAFFRGRLDNILAIAERHFERNPFAASQRPPVADL